jgi:hypothetical protein
MADFRFEHTFNCSQDTFWTKVFLDDEYNRRLFLERLKFSAWREVESQEKDGKLHRVVEATPPVVDLPGPLKALVGDNLRYREHGVLDRTQNRYSVTVVPNRLADKISVRIEIATRDDGPNRCRRVVSGTVEAKVFGLGGMIEKRTITDLGLSYEEGATFTNAFVAEKGLS